MNAEAGVGYEATIITLKLAENVQKTSSYPVLRQGNWDVLPCRPGRIKNRP